MFFQQHYVDQHRKAVTSHGVKDLKEAHSNFTQLYAFFKITYIINDNNIKVSLHNLERNQS